MTFALATIHDFGTGKDVPHVVTDFGFTSVVAAFDFSKVDTGFDLAPIFNAAFDLAPVSTTKLALSTTKLALSSLPVSSVLFLFYGHQISLHLLLRDLRNLRGQLFIALSIAFRWAPHG